MPKITYQKGFSLLELSVVVSIIALMTGGVLTLLTDHQRARNIRMTEFRMNAIERAIVAFVRNNQRIPFHADATLRVNNANFGIETNVGNLTVNDPPGPNDDYSAGMVPVKTLGLPEAFAYDAWGNRFTYVINWEHADSTATFTDPASLPHMEVSNNAANIITSEAVYVLMSHGPNGHGAWNFTGGLRLDRNVSSLNEIENAHVDPGEIWDNEFVQQSHDNSFDDIVRFANKSILRRKAREYLSDSLCNIAVAADGNGATICGATAQDPNCATYLDTLATRIDGLCQ